MFDVLSNALAEPVLVSAVGGDAGHICYDVGNLCVPE